MKNQYFGDVNDYRKYGIIRGLIGQDLKSLICWMLTSDDSRPDGKFTNYLNENNSSRWEVYDPELYKILRNEVKVKENRNVKVIEDNFLIPRAEFIKTNLSDDIRKREAWRNELLLKCNSKDIVFLDPDNGIEVNSVSKGTGGSSKYIFWDELQEIWETGASLLVYQHYPRINRDFFHEDIALKFRMYLGANNIIVFRTSYVAFFLIMQDRHSEELSWRAEIISNGWQKQIILEKL